MLRNAAETEVQENVTRVQTIADDLGVLAGAIAEKGTSDRYEAEAAAQRKAANLLRVLTVSVTLGAVVMAIWAVERNASDTHTLIAKLAVSTVLGGLATYTATQSGKHRRREERAKDLQLQLAAFGPFIAPLPVAFQEAERVRMTHRTFGARAGEEDDDDDLGPNFLGLLRQILQRETGSGPDISA
jgi:hypothetical protein